MAETVSIRLNPEERRRLVELVGERGHSAFIRKLVRERVGLEGSEVDESRLERLEARVRALEEPPRMVSPNEVRRRLDAHVDEAKVAVTEPASTVSESAEGECPFTAVQLAGKTGLPVASCQRAIDRGTWRQLL